MRGVYAMARKVSVSVAHDICVGNAMCVTIATNAFQLNDDRQSAPANPDGDTEELIMEAAENCPVSAITITDAITGEQLFP